MIFKDKRGQATEGLIDFVVGTFIIMIFIGIAVYTFNIITTSLSIDTLAGNVNLSSATADTIGQINTAILNKINLVGTMLLFGMVLALMINAFFTRHKYPKFFIIADILIILVVYIIAIYISNSYEIVIKLEPFSTFFLVNLEDPSRFLLNLPFISVILGVLIMIITYSGIPISRSEQIFIGGQR